MLSSIKIQTLISLYCIFFCGMLYFNVIYHYLHHIWIYFPSCFIQFVLFTSTGFIISSASWISNMILINKLVFTPFFFLWLCDCQSQYIQYNFFFKLYYKVRDSLRLVSPWCLTLSSPPSVSLTASKVIFSINKLLCAEPQWEACYWDHFTDYTFFFAILVKLTLDYILISIKHI